MNKILSIGITTFKNRLETVSKQIKSIRAINTDINILLTVNSNYGEEPDEQYRKDILKLCSDYNNIYPLCFPRFTGLSKMWNNLIVHSSTPFIYILNDDLMMSNPRVFDMILSHIKNIQTLDEELFEAPSGYSHFVISKKIAIELGFFDERLVGFGEEDGDFYWRYKSRFLKIPLKLPILGVHNIPGSIVAKSKIDFSHATEDPLFQFMPKIKRTPRFNTEFRMSKYIPNENGVAGMYQYKMAKRLKDEKQYPYEQFIIDNYDNLGKFNKII